MLYGGEPVFSLGNLFAVPTSIAAGAYLTPSPRLLLSVVVKALDAVCIVNSIRSRIREIDRSVEHGKSLYGVQGEVEFSEFGLEMLLQTKRHLKGLLSAFGQAEPLRLLFQVNVGGTDIHLFSVPQLHSIVGAVENEPELFDA